MLKGPKKCIKGYRCKKTGRRKICRRGKEARRKQKYYRVKGAAKRAIFKAKNAERKKFCEDLDGHDGKGNVFRLVK